MTPASGKNTNWPMLPILIIGTLLAFAIAIRLCGVDPLSALKSLVAGAFGSRHGLAATAARASVLTFYALGIVLSFRAGIFNIGAEGQSRVGAAAAAALGTGAAGASLANLSILGIAVILLAGAVAGALWSLLAGILRQKRGVSEVVATLMLNFVAIQFVQYLVSNPALLRSGNSIMQQTEELPPALQFSGWSGTEFHSGIFFAVPVAVITHILLFHTPNGLRLRAIGLNPFAARTNGVPIEKVSLAVFAASGAAAGFAGAMGILALGRLDSVPSYPEFGFMAIAVALVADLRPLAVVPAAIFFAGLDFGAKLMESNAGAPHWIIYFVQGLVILAVLIQNTPKAISAAPSAAAEAAE